MNRRRFLKATAAGAVVAYGGLSTAPEWLRRAFADGSSCPTGSGSPHGGGDVGADVAAALTRAKGLGKPLLVLVIPADDARKFERGEELGAFINNANDEQMVPLALCEVMCATVSDVRRVVPTLGPSEPRMLLVDTSVTPPTAAALDARLPPVVQANMITSGNPATSQQDEDATILARVAVLARLVSDAVMGDAAMLARRGAQARTALPGEASRAEHDASVGGPIATARVDRAAALVAGLADRAGGADKTRLTHLLATAAIERLRKRPPRGRTGRTRRGAAPASRASSRTSPSAAAWAASRASRSASSTSSR